MERVRITLYLKILCITSETKVKIVTIHSDASIYTINCKTFSLEYIGEAFQRKRIY